MKQYAQFQGRVPIDTGSENVFKGLLVQALIGDSLDPAVSIRVLAPAEYESFRLGNRRQPERTYTPSAEEVGGRFWCPSCSRPCWAQAWPWASAT